MLQKTEMQETILHGLYRERGSHAQGVYPTLYTPRMGTGRVK